MKNYPDYRPQASCWKDTVQGMYNLARCLWAINKTEDGIKTGPRVNPNASLNSQSYKSSV